MNCNAKSGFKWTASLMLASVISLTATAADVKTPVAPALTTPPANTAAKSVTTKPIAGKAAKADLEFLEYLGTMESDDDNWTDIEGNSNADAATKSPAVKTAVNPAIPKVESVNKSASKESGNAR